MQGVKTNLRGSSLAMKQGRGCVVMILTQYSCKMSSMQKERWLSLV